MSALPDLPCDAADRSSEPAPGAFAPGGPIVCAVDPSWQSSDVVDVSRDLAAKTGLGLTMVPVDGRLSALRELAVHEQASLVATELRSLSALRSRSFLNAVARLSADLPCPLLVVPRRSTAMYQIADLTRRSSVVCGIDGYDALPALVSASGWLARALKAQLVLMHAGPASRGSALPLANLRVGGSPYVAFPVPEVQRAAQAWLEDSIAGPVPEAVHVRAEKRTLAAAMADAGSFASVKLIAVGSGSDWPRFVHRTGCPVLVVPPV